MYYVRIKWNKILFFYSRILQSVYARCEKMLNNIKHFIKMQND